MDYSRLKKRDLIEQIEQLEKRIETLTANTAANNPQKISNLMNQLPCALLVETAEREIYQVNRSFLSIFGNSLKTANLLGQSTQQIWDSLNGFFDTPSAEALQKIETKISSGKFSTAGALLHTKDGRVLQCNYLPVESTDGDIEHMWCFRDVTVTREADLKHRLSEEKFYRYISHAPFGVFVIDKSGVIVEANNSAALITGYDQSELLQMQISKLVPEGRREKAIQNAKLLRSQGHFSGEGPFLTKKGEIRLWSLKAVQLSSDHFLGFVNDITEQKKSEDALGESRKILQDVLDTIPVRVFWKDVNSNYLGCNRLFARDAGRQNPDELLGQNDYMMSWKEQAGLYRSDDKQVIESGRAKINYEEPQTNEAGEIRWLRTSKVPLRDSNGSIYGVLGTYEDITEQRRANEELEKSEQKLRNIVEHSTNLFYSHTADHDLTYVSPQSRYFFDCEPEEAMTRWTEFITDNPLNKIGIELTDKAIQTGQRQPSYQLELRTKKDRIIWVEVNEAPLVVDGKTVAVIGSLTDITDSKLAEIALRESEEKFRELAELLPEVIFEADVKGNLTFVNKKAFEIFGYSRKDFEKGVNAIQTIAREDRKRSSENIQRVLNGLPAGNSEYTARRKDGSTFPVLIYSSPILQDNKPVGLRGIIVDITERRRLEEQLHHSQKMEAVGQLAGGVAHDFNNLLTIINGFCDLLNLQQLPAEVSEPVRQIQNAGKRAAELTSQLLAFSRKQIVQPRIVNLNAIVSNYIKMLGRLLGESIEIEMLLEPRLNNIKADTGQMEQIIMNISINARDAMAGGGKLTIKTKNVSVSNASADMPAGLVPGRYVMLKISDTGVGMDEEVLSRIFEPFYTTKARGKGTGLGLATVYGIVQQNRGAIHAESKRGKGSYFTVYLPAVVESVADGDNAQTEKTNYYGAECILLVEDDKAVCEVTKTTLERYGYQVLVAANGREALQIYDREKDKIDLVLTDMVMPVMSGRELAKKIRARNASLKILFFSGYTDDLFANDNMGENGSPGFIQKPFDQNDLLRKIRDMLKK